ncbi:MAG: hypothetical protein IJD82_01125 [Clostridia bacterium]|nr:hypothetical protein [Clostridia bacterium]
MCTSAQVIHVCERMFSTWFFEVYLNKTDFSTENSFAYYYDYFIFLIGITWLLWYARERILKKLRQQSDDQWSPLQLIMIHPPESDSFRHSVF